MAGGGFMPTDGGIRFFDVRNNTHPSWWKDPGLRKNVYYCAGLWLTFFMNGYDGSLFNGLQTIPQWEDYFHPSDSTLGLMNAALFLPSPPSALVAEFIGNRLGRRVVVWYGCCFVIAGAVVNASAHSLGQYIAGRAIMGWGTAATLTVGPTLCQEIAHPRYRAQVGSMYTSVYYTASVTSAVVTLGCRYIHGERSWRIPCFLQLVGPVMCLFFTLLTPGMGPIPESPRWLWKHGRQDAARAQLAKYHANGDMNDPLVELECKEIERALAEEAAASQTSYFDYFRTPGNRRRLFVLCVVAVGTNWVGNGIISYYLSPILNSVGITEPQQTSGINVGLQIWNLILSVGAALLVERIGRRPLWLISTIGMLGSYVVVMALSATFANTAKASVGIATIPFLFVSTAGRSLPCPRLMFGSTSGSTISPGRHSPPCTPSRSSLSISASRDRQYSSLFRPSLYRPTTGSTPLPSARSIGSMSRPTWLLMKLTYRYGVYVAILTGMVIIIWFYFPETKNLTIEEIGYIFDIGRAGGRSAAIAHMHARENAEGDAAEVGSVHNDQSGMKL